MKILKDILSVTFSTILGKGTGILITFLLPAILSLADYGNYQGYITYLAFTYLLNFGYNDGIYIKYGSVNSDNLDKKVLHKEHNFIIIFQLLILFLSIMIVLLTDKGNSIFIFFLFASFFDAIGNYHGNFLKATGDFSRFSKGNSIKSSLYIIVLLIAIYIFRIDNYQMYIIFNILSLVILAAYFEYYFYKKNRFLPVIDLKTNIRNFKTGISVLISNSSLTFVGNLGRLIAKTFYTSTIFAQYGFQNSLLNIMLVVANAVGMVFYRIISQKEDRILLNMIKEISILIGIFSGIGFFILKVIILSFMDKFTPSLSLLSVTFIAIPYIIVSNMLIANLYRAKVSQKIYLRDSVLYAILSFLTVYTLHAIYPYMITIAIGTTICYIMWFAYTTLFQFKYLKNSIIDVFIALTHIIVFSITSNMTSILIGLVLYLFYLVAVLLMKRTMIYTIFNYLKIK